MAHRCACAVYAPAISAKGITQFVLVARQHGNVALDLVPPLYDCMIVEMAEGKSTVFTVRPITVKVGLQNR